MEKTMARAIYKKMEINKQYTTSELFDLIEKDYYKYTSIKNHPGQEKGMPVNKKIANEMWKIVKAGYATTFKKSETYPLIRGIKFGEKPKYFKTYDVRYWIRTK